MRVPEEPSLCAKRLLGLLMRVVVVGGVEKKKGRRRVGNSRFLVTARERVVEGPSCGLCAASVDFDSLRYGRGVGRELGEGGSFSAARVQHGEGIRREPEECPD